MPISNEFKVRINERDLLELFLAFKEICRAKIELDYTTRKPSLNDFYQELLRKALNNFFADQHKEIINNNIKSAVKKVFKDEMRYFIKDIKEITIDTKADIEYIKSLSNVMYKTQIETEYDSDNKDFFDSDYNLHSEFLKTPVTLEKYANKLETKKHIIIANNKKNR